MTKLSALLALLLPTSPVFASDVLIVADEFPAMRVLVDRIKDGAALDAALVTQTNLPSSLSSFATVIVYLHGDLDPRAEEAFIEYADHGGKLVLLHHSISSGKRKNARWFKFLGVELPEGKPSEGGYQWIESVGLDIVNLAPAHFITTNRVDYPTLAAYESADTRAAGTRPAFHLEDSEVYLNHVLIGPRTVLLGFRYVDAKSGRIYQQDRAGWLKPANRGWIIYLMPGHRAKDFENPTYARIVVNAVTWKP